MMCLNGQRSRAASLVALVLSLGLLASTSFAACCGLCMTPPAQQQRASAHDCCPSKKVPAKESLRADCVGCELLPASAASALLPAKASDKAPAPRDAAVLAPAIARAPLRLAPIALQQERGPPGERQLAHASTVLIL